MTVQSDGMPYSQHDKQIVIRWNWKNLTGGAIQTLVGIGLFYISMGYDFGTSVQMGPGYLPRILSAIFVVLGILTMATARHPVEVHGELEREPVNWRPPLFVFGSILLFMLLIERAGFVVTLFAVTVCARMADRNATWRSSLIVAALTTAINVAIFVLGLQMPFKLWWW